MEYKGTMMSNIKLDSGSSVSRFYDDGSGELLAVFQYHCDATSWAKARLASDTKNDLQTSLVVSSMYDGTSTMFCNKKAAK
jgi:hypothetical protein